MDVPLARLLKRRHGEVRQGPLDVVHGRLPPLEQAERRAPRTDDERQPLVVLDVPVRIRRSRRW